VDAVGADGLTEVEAGNIEDGKKFNQSSCIFYAHLTENGWPYSFCHFWNSKIPMN
jgi:hypothetical protein